MVCISSWLLSLILLLIWSLSCFSFWKRPKAKTPFCLKIHQNLIKRHGRKTSLAIKSSKYSLHWPCKVCWCIELLRRSSAKSSSILFLLGMWLQSGPAFLHMETFFFPLSGLFIWPWSGCSKSCLLPYTYSCPEGLNSVEASTHLCSLGELWFLKIDRKLCSFPLVYFFEW